MNFTRLTIVITVFVVCISIIYVLIKNNANWKYIQKERLKWALIDVDRYVNHIIDDTSATDTPSAGTFVCAQCTPPKSSK